MRIVIESLGIIMIIPDWFCEQEHITDKSRTAEKIRESEKAVLLNINGADKWIPKSLIITHKIPQGLGAWIEE